MLAVSDAVGGTAEACSCLHVLPLKLSNLGTRDCLSVRRSRSNQSTSGPSAFASSSQVQSEIFNLAIDSKLRACDLVKLRLDDVCLGMKVRNRATIVQKKTGRPVQFEITEQSRISVEACLPKLRSTGSRFLFPSRLHESLHISTRQYARLVHYWVQSIGLDANMYGTHSMRHTKAALIYRKTGNLRAVQILLGHTKLESTVRYLGIEVDDALNMAEQIEL